jgi:hypothetical protein
VYESDLHSPVSLNMAHGYCQLSMYFFAIFAASYCVCVRAGLFDFNLRVILPVDDSSSPWSIYIAGPAIEVAVATVHRHALLPPHYAMKVKYLDAAPWCFGNDADLEQHTTDLQADLLIGCMCDQAVGRIARYSSYWRVPFVSARAFSSRFENKLNTQYNLLTRIQGSYANIADFVVEVCQQHNWTRVGVVYSKGTPQVDTFGSSECTDKMHVIAERLENTHNSIQFIYCQSVQLIGLRKDIQQMHTYVSTEE